MDHDLLQEFLIETNEGLALADRELVALEQHPQDKALLSSIFRVVHTIKGTCGFVGLPRLEALTHATETVLGRFRNGTLAVTPAAITVIFNVIDRIKVLLVQIEAHQVELEGDDAALIAQLTAGARGEWSTTLVVAQEQPAFASIAEQSIRVDLDVLEKLMTTVSELVLTRNQLLQVVDREQTGEISTSLQRLNLVTSELQDSVMKVRMQPIGHAWQALPRIVRDLSVELGKKIELVTVGQETELDRQVLELIKDPLTHMVRNAADHGLETPATRLAAGKPEAGTITLSAYHEGGYIVIKVADDGPGLDLDRIKHKVVASGLATQDELAVMADAQIYKYIFAAGFSTATTVTTVSGRGVGMDVVRTNIEKIGGTVDLASMPGLGSSFTVKIPLTLTIVNALIVEAAGERYAIPQVAVTELLQAKAGTDMQIEYLNASPVLRLRERLLPLLSLQRLLHLERVGGSSQEGTASIVVMQIGGGTFGLIVDCIFGIEEIVVKPVASLLRTIDVFSGTTILGDGSVIMILDPIGIAKTVGPNLQNVAFDVPTVKVSDIVTSHDALQLLLFQAGAGARKAVPLALITRLEAIDFATVEQAGRQAVVQYREQLMPILPLIGCQLPATGVHPILVVSDQNHMLGLAVETIIDITEQRLQIDLSHEQPGLLGRTIIEDQVVEVIDVSHYITAAGKHWSGATTFDGSALLQTMQRLLQPDTVIQ